MKVPVSWLTEYCDPGWEPGHLAERLAMTGTEVERVASAGTESADGFVVGLVKAVEAHPDADRLSVCTVDDGEGERTIVCGAPNVDAGQLVPVALPGAVMPDGTKLKKAKLRGVESNGMILSEAELELGEDADGIMVLGLADEDGAAEPGAPLSEILPLAESVLELEVTSNRPDCQAVYGVAREVHAISEAPLARPPWSDDADATGEGEASDYASVKIEVPDLCPRFTARVFTEIEVGPSPGWLKARLTAAGQRPINNVVDITNYVMLMTGQPLHAFDLDEVPGGEIIVRTANEGEKLTTLDGVERELDSETVLVCDREKPTGLAGIMGGLTSEVSEKTTRVLLEVANWDGVNVLRTSRRQSLRSEASGRFEKQIHSELTMHAQRVASKLMIELCGAKMVPGTIDEGPGLPDPGAVVLRVPRVESLIGLAIDAGTCAERLERLGFGVSASDGEIEATVPPERAHDVTREADLIEEVARLADLDTKLPSTLPAVPERIGRLSREQLLRRRAEDALRDTGADEIVGWSLTDPGLSGRLRLADDDPRSALVEISNPLSSEQSVARPLLLGSLLDAARLNISRGAEHVALFESGHVYLREGESGYPGDHPSPAHEPHRLGHLATGIPPASWRGEVAAPDFFSSKAVLEALCISLGAEFAVLPAEEPFLHPGRSAKVLVGDREAGWIGELHPLVARGWDLEGGVAFELDLESLITAATAGEESYEDVTTFPPVLQDIAVVVPEDLPAAELRGLVLEGGGELLRSAEVFDLYHGDQVAEGSKSLALRLSFRAPDRTLTEDEVAGLRERIRESLAGAGGSFRE